MIKRIKIKDYMAHHDTELELGPGVTVLTGPNNSGKSAVVEALRSVAQNPPPHHVIRHGASQAVVRVELDSGEAVEWVRGRGNSVYRLYKGAQDGSDAEEAPEVYAKFGRMPPEDIRRLLRLDPVETESGAVDIHIGNQRYPIFLLDQTGSQAASFFAASTEAEYLLRVQQTLKTKTDRARGKRKELLQEGADLEARLERYLPLVELEPELVALETRHAALVAAQEALPRLQRSLEVLEETNLLYARKEDASSLLNELADPPSLHETRGLELILQELTGVLSQSEAAAAKTAALTPLSGPPVPADPTPLAVLIQAWERDQSALSGRYRASEALESLEMPPALHEVARIEALVRDLKRTESSHSRSVAAGSALDALAAPAAPSPATPLKQTIQQLAAAATALELCSAGGVVLDVLVEPPELHAVRPIEELADSMAHVRKRLEATQGVGAVLARLAAAPEPGTVAAGDDLLVRMSVLQGQLEANARLQDEVTAAIAAKRGEIEQALEELALCPLCGHPFDMDHFLEASHG